VEAINTFVDPPALRASVGPRNVLSAKWASVIELLPTPWPIVRGAIPRCLVGGAYICNGPNPQHLPRGPHQLFDSDSMLTPCSRRGLIAWPAHLATLRPQRTHEIKITKPADGERGKQ
jgi:hypothetical protein